MDGIGESVKFKLRRARVEEMERQQELEDRAHLGMTSEQHQLLSKTFESVKTEFEDLDGLSWESEDARGMLRDWKRKQVFITMIQPYRQSKGLPLIQHSSFATRSSFTISGIPTSRTRPGLPSTFAVPPPMPPRGSMSRCSTVTSCEDSDSQYIMGEDETALVMNIAMVSRRLAATGTTSQRQVTETTPNYADNSTLGQSWGNGSKARTAIPASFRPTRPRELTGRPSMEQYIESGGTILGSLAHCFDGENRSRDTPDSTDERRVYRGGSVPRVPPGIQAAAQAEPTTVPDASDKPTPKSNLDSRTPPPIIAASPRLGGSANALWGERSPRHASSPTLGSPRQSNSKFRVIRAELSSHPRASFHRERCTVPKCRTGRRRAASLEFQEHGGWTPSALGF